LTLCSNCCVWFYLLTMPLVVGHSQTKYLSDYLCKGSYTVFSYSGYKTLQFMYERDVFEVAPFFSVSTVHSTYIYIYIYIMIWLYIVYMGRLLTMYCSRCLYIVIYGCIQSPQSTEKHRIAPKSTENTLNFSLYICNISFLVCVNGFN
jgi:hypothetical protein